MSSLHLIGLATLGVAVYIARVAKRNSDLQKLSITTTLIEGMRIRKEVKIMAEITAELFDNLLDKLEQLADADPEDKATIERLQREVSELTLQAASQDAKYGWINDNERQARVTRLAEKVGLGNPLPPTGPEAPLPPGPAPETPVEEVPPTDVSEPVVDEGTGDVVVDDSVVSDEAADEQP